MRRRWRRQVGMRVLGERWGLKTHFRDVGSCWDGIDSAEIQPMSLRRRLYSGLWTIGRFPEVIPQQRRRLHFIQHLARRIPETVTW